MTDATPEITDPEIMLLAEKVFDLARHGDTDALAAYVDAGVPVNHTNDQGASLLMLAAYHGHDAAVIALVERGADLNRTDAKGQTPLSGAVFKSEDEVVRTLLAHGADPSAGTPSAIEVANMFSRQDLLELFTGK